MASLLRLRRPNLTLYQFKNIMLWCFKVKFLKMILIKNPRMNTAWPVRCVLYSACVWACEFVHALLMCMFDYVRFQWNFVKSINKLYNSGLYTALLWLENMSKWPWDRILFKKFSFLKLIVREINNLMWSLDS